MARGNVERIKMSTGDQVTKLICQIICLFFLAVFLVPVCYVVISSLCFHGEISLGGYRLLLENKAVLTGFKNSVLLAAMGTFFSLLLEIPLAYVLSKKRYGKLTSLVYGLGQFGVAILPLYLLLKKLGLLNSLWGLILPSAMSVYYTLHLRARMLTLASELEDAALLDGCGPIRYLLRICLPVMGPTIAVFAFWHTCSYWSNLLLANTILTDESKFPLMLVLNQILIKNQAGTVFGTGLRVESVAASKMAEFALCVIATVPMIGLFLLLKRHVKAIETDDGIVL